MSTNWDKFEECLPVGTLVKASRDLIYRGDRSVLLGKDEEGILMRHGRESIRPQFLEHLGDVGMVVSWMDGAVVQFYRHIPEERIDPDFLLYFLDGQWRSFDEVMV